MANDEKKKEKTKLILAFILIGSATFLTYKFISWNYWKVTQSIQFTRRVLNEHGAVNLTLSKDGKRVFQKGFQFNKNGNFYIITYFDLKHYLRGNNALNTEIRINEKKISDVKQYSFPDYDILGCEGHYFVFTGMEFPIETLPALEKNLPSIIKSLALPGQNENSGKKL